ncbi:MAG: SMC-Scp complex subunit ScpB [Acutalibacteraceae bacterium]
MKEKEMQNMLEAVLFAVGEPIELQRLSQALEIDELMLEHELQKLKEKYEDGSGLRLLRLGDKYQLCSATQYASQIRSVLEIKKNAPLSQAAFEVLAIIAYNQPVTKAFVEQVRGVDCSGVISSLCKKELIEEKGRLELPGRPLVYATTANFLRCFSMSSLDELPKLPEKHENESSENETQAENEKNSADDENDLAQGVDEIKNLE